MISFLNELIKNYFIYIKKMIMNDFTTEQINTELFSF